MDPAQQKMMRYMPLMMVIFCYNYSSGLALYWTVSNAADGAANEADQDANPDGRGARPAPRPRARHRKRSD